MKKSLRILFILCILSSLFTQKSMVSAHSMPANESIENFDPSELSSENTFWLLLEAPSIEKLLEVGSFSNDYFDFFDTLVSSLIPFLEDFKAERRIVDYQPFAEHLQSVDARYESCRRA